jgi:hypothetical protein
MKCNYKHCPYGGQVEKEKAIKVKNKYYHKNCYLNQENWKKFIEIYDKYIIPKTKEGFTIIGKGLKQLINKEPNVEYLVYVLCQIIKQQRPLNSIFGMHYYINDYKIRNQYKINVLSKQININVDNIETEEETKIKHKRTENKLWGDILQK